MKKITFILLAQLFVFSSYSADKQVTILNKTANTLEIDLEEGKKKFKLKSTEMLTFMTTDSFLVISFKNTFCKDCQETCSIFLKNNISEIKFTKNPCICGMSDWAGADS